MVCKLLGEAGKSDEKTVQKSGKRAALVMQ